MGRGGKEKGKGTGGSEHGKGLPQQLRTPSVEKTQWGEFSEVKSRAGCRNSQGDRFVHKEADLTSESRDPLSEKTAGNTGSQGGGGLGSTTTSHGKRSPKNTP